MSSAYELESEKQLDLDHGSEENLANTRGPARKDSSASQSNDIHQALQANKGGPEQTPDEIITHASVKINKQGSTMTVRVRGKDHNGRPETISMFRIDFLFDSWKKDLTSRLKTSIDGWGFKDPAKAYKKALSLVMKKAEKEVQNKKEEWGLVPRKLRT